MSTAGANAVAQVVSALCAFLIIGYLGLALYSEYATAMLFTAGFAMFTRLGFNRVFLRECSRDVSLTPAYLGSALALNGVLTTATLAVAFVIAYFRYDTRIFVLVIILGSSSMCQGFTQTPRTVFQVHQRLNISAMISLASSLFYVSAVVVGIFVGVSVFALAVFMLIMNVFRVVALCVIGFRIDRPRLNWANTKALFRVGLRFCAIDLLMMLNTSMRGFTLAIFDMGEQVGLFQVAARLFSVTELFAQTVDIAISPAIYAAADTPERMIRGAHLVLRYFTVFGMFMSAVFFARAEWVLDVLFPAEFTAAATVLRVYGLAIACRYLVILLAHLVYAEKAESFMLKTFSALASASVVGCLLIIPRHGAIGAAGLASAGEFVFCVVCLIKASRLFPASRLWTPLVFPLLAAAATSAFLFATGSWPLVSVLASPFVFVALLAAVGYYRWGEVTLILSTLRQKR